MEFLLGGISACGAGFFTNPLEVVKTRMQLQGELKAKGQYCVHYKNVFHAFYTIGKVDGLLALQKGLVPALWYQFLMNGWRLGAYQCFINMGLTTDKNGHNSWLKSVAAGATAGSIGAAVGSPVYMIKTHLQASADQSIAVGYQHKHQGMWAGLRRIYCAEGVKGLWRGVDGAIARVMVGSAAQLSTFTTSKQFYTNLELFPKNSVFNAILASMTSGVVVVACMTPFDVISTRLYNQGTGPGGKGLYYNGVFDCFTKILRSEGIWGFYKGWAASLFRLGPHTILSLSMWDQTRRLYFHLQQKLNHAEEL